MKATILFASPRPEGNTAAILGPVRNVLEENGIACTTMDLYRKQIRPCLACRYCQRDWESACCVQQDDMGEIFGAVMESDLILLATPIYSWYCTPPMKAALDRLVYALNKYYGEEKGPSLWAGKAVAIVTTCGYRPEKGADLFEEGIRRYCKHSRLRYLGLLAERHLGWNVEFMDERKKERAEAFARDLVRRLQEEA